ncbi:hypothetical protein HNR60_002651 [Rhodopseudomonas rhenobacensis]|uniref:Uncharacterized protein n=1 Tax=Rhodopseudomonas rhenobacensis TaxID=87461 RepID=A0A7W7Z4N9_9BRAD|nr:hypothetical protein [Rhodopseudomonas rhenobacensis]MBB5047894.1 hypothetical protein [Rhodopseudomonas rhenobacensis]
MAMTRTALAIGSVLLLSGLGVYGLSSQQSPREPVSLAEAAPAAAEDDASNPQTPPPAAAPRNPRDARAMLPAATAPLGRISLVRQSWKRGGMGSQALATFTVHNRNRFPIKDLEIRCAFRSDDGSYRTERRRVLPDTVRRRKTFTDTLVGHVNLNATYGKCSLLGASRA